MSLLNRHHLSTLIQELVWLGYYIVFLIVVHYNHHYSTDILRNNLAHLDCMKYLHFIIFKIFKVAILYKKFEVFYFFLTYHLGFALLE